MRFPCNQEKTEKSCCNDIGETYPFVQFVVFFTMLNCSPGFQAHFAQIGMLELALDVIFAMKIVCIREILRPEAMRASGWKMAKSATLLQWHSLCEANKAKLSENRRTSGKRAYWSVYPAPAARPSSIEVRS